MTNLEALPQTVSRGGGRIASELYRQSLSYCRDFTGLEENTDRYDLLLLTKRVGKLAGFTSRMIQLLEYYMAFTRECDWEEGSRPIIYQALARTALDLSVSERQIQKLEKQLFEVGAITWNDSGNHKRYGKRNAHSGKIEYAYGVDLTPLAYLRADLTEKLHDKQLYDQAWLETKREISWYRRQIRSLLLEADQGNRGQEVCDLTDSYQTIAVQIRTSMCLDQLRDLLSKHQLLHAELAAQVVSTPSCDIAGLTSKTRPANAEKSSCRSDTVFAHKEYNNPFHQISSSTNSGFQRTDAAASTPKQSTSNTGVEHITLKQAIACSCSRFQEYLPLTPHPLTWQDVIEAAYRLRSDLSISQDTWADACNIMGRVGAAVSAILTSRAMQRANNPVENPSGYFRAMIERAKCGELHLHRSIFGLSERQHASRNVAFSRQHPLASSTQ